MTDQNSNHERPKTGGKQKNKNLRLAIVMLAAVCIGVGVVAALSRGIDFVIAADIHPTINKPQETRSNAPEQPGRITSLPKRTADSGAGSAAQGGNTRQAHASQSSQSSGKVLGECTTKFTAKPKSRNENIRLAAKSLKGVVVQPGETFSYNDTIGPTTKANGYQRAQIFVSGKKSYGYGGGVCQVSSTLFNAAENAGMEIVERHKHSLPVTYVPKGKDAATSHGSVDFRFKNTQSYPVMIESGVSDTSVTIKIVG